MDNSNNEEDGKIDTNKVLEKLGSGSDEDLLTKFDKFVEEKKSEYKQREKGTGDSFSSEPKKENPLKYKSPSTERRPRDGWI